MAEKLIHAFVICNLDYCNLWIAQRTTPQKSKSFKTQYMYPVNKCDSITPALQSLNWLPIHARIIFNLLLTFQCCL